MSEDVRLAERCLAGDEQAWGEFVAKFQNPVFGVCLRMLTNQHDAEDVSQDSLVRAIRHLQRWDRQRPLMPWVLTIAVNRCRTKLGQRALTVSSSAYVESAAAPPSKESNQALSEELERALGFLRPDYRLCFVLFYQQELTIEQVAEVLSCPSGTVKTWLHRARKELAKRLIDRGVTNEVGYELHGL